MEIKVRHDKMNSQDYADTLLWERNVLALLLADGWYNDYVQKDVKVKDYETGEIGKAVARFSGQLRVLSCLGGLIEFHISDDFDIGQLAQIDKDWSGHANEETWTHVMKIGNQP